MTHLNRSDLERVRNGDVSAEEAAAFGRHIGECSECAAVAGDFLGLANTAAAYDAAFAMNDLREHPDEEVLAAYVDGTISAAARRDVDEHLQSCDECSDDIADLRRLVAKQQSRRFNPLWIGLAAAAAIAMMFVLPQWQNDPQTVEPPQAVTRTTAPATTTRRDPPVAIKTLPAEWSALLAQTKKTGVLPFPTEIRALATEDVFRGDPQAAAQGTLWPVATAVEDEQPELRWPEMTDAQYTVSVTSKGKEIARSDSLTKARWRLPLALSRDAMYRWQVRVKRGAESFVLPAPPAPPAIFRVISRRERDELVRARAEAGDDHLLLALLYARAGIVDAARRELQAYERSSQDPLAERLRRQLPT